IKTDRPPIAWKIEHYLHVFLGLILGWILFYVLLLRLGIFDGKLNLSQLGWTDLILFVGGWIGINGRLPTIAHDVQNWFARK
ncbi:MAG: hypothetical protein HYU48_01645, partial [Candidatus Levybacteria bacterium]|nr:hypothetical protein [Candidatus Levybacteria bacterium]